MRGTNALPRLRSSGGGASLGCPASSPFCISAYPVLLCGRTTSQNPGQPHTDRAPHRFFYVLTIDRPISCLGLYVSYIAVRTHTSDGALG